MHGITIPARINLAIAAGIAAAVLGALFMVPWLLRQGHGLAAWLLVPFALAAIPHWALVHEAVHRHLHTDPATNERLGRHLAILFLAPFEALRFGHLSHHALNARPSERPEIYDPRRRSHLRAMIEFYGRLLGGLNLVEIASGPISLLPRRLLRPMVRRLFYDGTPDAYMADRAEHVLLAPATLRRIRCDALAILALLGAGFIAYGDDWPVLVAALLGRAFVVSIMDNAPHYGGPLAQPDQGYDMHLPKQLAGLILHTNLHGTHHRHPNLPWSALPTAFAADGRAHDGSFLLRPWRQLGGPVPIDDAVRR
ncbi:MAG: fatty acid desaturase [Geminicoccaceae bacterium]